MAYISDCIDGIATQLHAVSSFPVYVDFRKQKATFPCWYIDANEIDHEQKLNTRYWREGEYTISLFLSDEGDIIDNRALHDWAEKLFWALEYISVNGDTVHGTGMKYEFVDDVLKFKVSYNYFIHRIEHRDTMQSLDINEGVKHEEKRG